MYSVGVLPAFARKWEPCQSGTGSVFPCALLLSLSCHCVLWCTVPLLVFKHLCIWP